MDNFLIHAAIAYLLLAVGGLLWTHFESGFFGGLLAFALGMVFYSLLRYLVKGPSHQN